MGLHAEPIVYTLRWYEGDKTYENRDTYDVVATVMMLDGRAFLCAMHGAITREAWEAIRQWMMERGIEEVEVVRHGKRKTYMVNGATWT